MRKALFPVGVLFILLISLFGLNLLQEKVSGLNIVYERVALESNDDLDDQARERQWPGNGTEEEPYIIQGKLLESNWSGVCIYIENVDRHLLFRDCVISDDWNVSFPEGLGNAYIGSSSNITFENCTIASGTMEGIRFDRSSNCSVINCRINGNGDEFGMSIYDSSDIDVKECIFFGSNEWVLYISGSSRMGISDSEFSLGGGSLAMEVVKDSIISNNTFQNGGEFQVILLGCMNVTFNMNRMKKCPFISVVLQLCEGLKVSNNSLLGTYIGFYILDTSSSVFSGNLMDSHYLPLYFWGGVENSFHGNVMVNSSFYLKGTTEELGSMEISDDNTVNGRPVLFIKDRDLKGAEVRKDVGIIFMVNVTNARISNRNMTGSYSPVTLIGCSSIKVEECELRWNWDGVVAKDCEDLSIHDNLMEASQTGFHLERCNDSSASGNDVTGDLYMIGSHRNTIGYNSFTNVYNSVLIELSDDNAITNNYIEGSLQLKTSFRCLITDNTIVGDELLIPEDILWDPEQPDIKGNTINGRRKDYILHRIEEDLNVPEDTEWLVLFNLTRCGLSGVEMEIGYKVEVLYCNDLTISDSSFGKLNEGLEIIGSVRANLIDSEFTLEGGKGVVLRNSESCRIERNLFYRCENSISIEGCSRLEIISNRIERPEDYGILLTGYSTNTLILRNQINSSTGAGIGLRGSFDSLVSGNRIMNSEDYGIVIYYDSQRNMIYNNRFEFNKGSMEMYNDLRRQARDDGSSNVWYYDSPDVDIGNYWTDLQGPDDNHDGEVDDVYYMDGFSANYDLYPMVEGYEEKDDLGSTFNRDLWLTIFFMGILLWLVGLVAYKYFNKR